MKYELKNSGAWTLEDLVMVVVDLGLIGTTLDGFAQIKRWPMDQVAAGFVNGFAGFVGDCWKSRSGRSEVEPLSMQQPADPAVSAADQVEVVCYRWLVVVLTYSCCLLVVLWKKEEGEKKEKEESEQ